MQSAPAPASPDVASRRQTWPAVRRWVMVAVLVALLGAVPVLASFGAHEGKLEQGLRSGVVTEVAVGMPVHGPGSDRERTVRVAWRDRLLQHHAEVPVGKGDRSPAEARGELIEAWQELNPEVRVTDGGSGSTGGSFGPVAKDVEVPSWMAATWLVVLLGSVVRLVTGPQTHVFTKWGWFWMLWFVPVLGALTFWCGGDRPGAPAPVAAGRRDRRFRGGAGFMAAFGLAGALMLVSVVL